MPEPPLLTSATFPLSTMCDLIADARTTTPTQMWGVRGVNGRRIFFTFLVELLDGAGGESHRICYSCFRLGAGKIRWIEDLIRIIN
jgi:hypothetical protein